MSTFHSSPRDYALELAEEGLVDVAHLLLCCLKYMSHDDVRGMLEANELAPNHCDADDCSNVADDDEQYCDECKQVIANEAFIDEHIDGYDTDAMKVDIENGNFDIECDDVEVYSHDSIVGTSIENGQIKQARKQCEEFGLDWEDYSELLKGGE